MKIKLSSRTPIKSRAIPFIELKHEYCIWLPLNTELDCTISKNLKDNHYELNFNKEKLTGLEKEIIDKLINRKNWYVYVDHVTVQDPLNQYSLNSKVDKVNVDTSEIILDVPYCNQLDNEFNPNGSCNVSSMAMVLRYFGYPKVKDGLQLEDYLYKYMEDTGLDRHSVDDIRYLIEKLGFNDEVRLDCSIDDLEEAIKEGKPCIIHTMATDSGHIMVVIGFNKEKKEFIVNDSNGCYPYSDYSSGERVRYSYDFINEIANIDPGDSIWGHFISK